MPTRAVVVDATSLAVAYPANTDVLQTFTAATRAATVPRQSGQVGYETDSHLFYYSTSTSAGAWTALAGGGATFSSGAGAPSGGNNGDGYIRTSNCAFYLKIAGVWTILFYGAVAVSNTAAQFICPDTVTRDATLAT